MREPTGSREYFAKEERTPRITPIKTYVYPTAFLVVGELHRSSGKTATMADATELQWPSHYPSTTALIRLRDTYVECFRAPESDKSTRLEALQSAAAYYVLRHTQLVWNTSNRPRLKIFLVISLPIFSSTCLVMNGVETMCSNTFSVSKTARSL